MNIFLEFLNDRGFAPSMVCQAVDEETFSRYRGTLPDRLINYWQLYGFCGYVEGLFWTVNPADFEDILVR